MRETDLYAPVKAYLEGQGYEVKAEVDGCDVVARRGAEPLVIVELKLTLNLELILQAIDRQKLNDAVYVAVPDDRRRKSRTLLRRSYGDVLRLVRMLGLGLMVVGFRSHSATVDVRVDSLAEGLRPGGTAAASHGSRSDPPDTLVRSPSPKHHRSFVMRTNTVGRNRGLGHCEDSTIPRRPYSLRAPLFLAATSKDSLTDPNALRISAGRRPSAASACWLPVDSRYSSGTTATGSTESVLTAL